MKEKDKRMKEIIKNFIKKETVLFVATILAIASAFVVKPSAAYMEYIDWRVLGILLSLMIVMAGLQKNGLFDTIGAALLKKTKNTLQLSLVLVFLCFFFSMLITNDVALITFVPFAMLTMGKCGQEKLLMPVVVLQTIAANLGSMLTPIGNPQNLYLYNLAGMGMGEFILCMLPYTAISAVLILFSVIWIARKKEKIQVAVTEKAEETNQETVKWKTYHKNVVYITMFVLSLLVVARVLPYYMVLLLILLLVFYMDREVLKQVDYCLLLTFISFFIFTGNMGNIPAVNGALKELVAGRELMTGVLSSQVISNVPAALLLSGFTSDYKALLYGVNIGGLGTLIASMASLISYKCYAHTYNEKKGAYLVRFTITNVLFLVVLIIAAMLLFLS